MTKRYGAQWRLDYNNRRAALLASGETTNGPRLEFKGTVTGRLPLNTSQFGESERADNVVHVKFGDKD